MIEPGHEIVTTPGKGLETVVLEDYMSNFVNRLVADLATRHKLFEMPDGLVATKTASTIPCLPMPVPVDPTPIEDLP